MRWCVLVALVGCQSPGNVTNLEVEGLHLAVADLRLRVDELESDLAAAQERLALAGAAPSGEDGAPVPRGNIVAEVDCGAPSEIVFKPLAYRVPWPGLVPVVWERVETFPGSGAFVLRRGEQQDVQVAASDLGDGAVLAGGSYVRCAPSTLRVVKVVVAP